MAILLRRRHSRCARPSRRPDAFARDALRAPAPPRAQILQISIADRRHRTRARARVGPGRGNAGRPSRAASHRATRPARRSAVRARVRGREREAGGESAGIPCARRTRARGLWSQTGFPPPRGWRSPPPATAAAPCCTLETAPRGSGSGARKPAQGRARAQSLRTSEGFRSHLPEEAFPESIRGKFRGKNFAGKSLGQRRHAEAGEGCQRPTTALCLHPTCKQASG